MNLTNIPGRGRRLLGGDSDRGADEYSPQRPPAPMIRANGSAGPVVLRQGESVHVTISLDAGDREGASCEWWLAARAEIDGRHQWYSYRHAGRWLAGLRPARLEDDPTVLNPDFPASGKPPFVRHLPSAQGLAIEEAHPFLRGATRFFSAST